MLDIKTHDVVVVGGGLAGIVSAIDLALSGKNVAIIYDGKINDTSSYYAQGGIAAVVSKDDSVDLHVKDTMLASSNSAEYDAVKDIIRSSTDAIKWLEDNGVEFDSSKNYKYSLHLEGGHSLSRILHIKDHTGRSIIESLFEKLVKLDNIVIYEETAVFKVLKNKQKCSGVYIYSKSSGVSCIIADSVILATGGASGIYKYSTKPKSTYGTGMMVAYEAGCELKHLEFTQFHPTCFNGGEFPLLISEAVRGSGATLERLDGFKIMQEVHPSKDLAPRDVVAREIYKNIQQGYDIYLNATNLNSMQWQLKFPFIYNSLMKLGINPSKDRILISPAAHYSCGGIVVDSHARTSLRGLYAVGECSYTGLHGANRLASNSLLECVVYALKASKDIQTIKPSPSTKDTIVPYTDINIELFNTIKYVNKIKDIMWNYVGLIRTAKQLEQAISDIEIIKKEVDALVNNNGYNYAQDNLIKMIDLVHLTAKSAYKRKNSIGSHYLD